MKWVNFISSSHSRGHQWKPYTPHMDLQIGDPFRKVPIPKPFHLIRDRTPTPLHCLRRLVLLSFCPGRSLGGGRGAHASRATEQFGSAPSDASASQVETRQGQSNSAGQEGFLQFNHVFLCLTSCFVLVWFSYHYNVL